MANDTATEANPFDGYEPPASADRIILNGPGAWFSMKVEEVSQPFDAEYGQVFTIQGTVTGLGGDIDAPEKGEEGSFLMAWEKTSKGKTGPGHVREEIIRGIKAAGRRTGSLEPGDEIAVKLEEEVWTGKDGKRFKNAFKRHIARALNLAAPVTPFPGEDAPF